MSNYQDEKMAAWREKLAAMDDAQLREQTNRQLQPDVYKRVAAEHEVEKRTRRSALANAQKEIQDLKSELVDTRAGARWTKAQVLMSASGWIVAVVLLADKFIK